MRPSQPSQPGQPGQPGQPSQPGQPGRRTTFGTLLVANRGEIAVRVIRSARRMGLRTVAVYSDADRGSPHVRLADTAVRIGPAAAAESYLDVAAILAAAHRTGADAVHPGYGFLSERAELARAVTGAGLTFVGPTAEVMDTMGRKDVAREVAVAAGVPVVPVTELSRSGLSRSGLSGSGLSGSGPSGAGPDVASALPGSGHPGPLLVKAAAGGGGKGMRVVRDPADLEQALAAAQREARAAFGDDTMLVERYVEHGRHVEVQVLADEHGTVVHLGERDCSVQRRHQKVLEEAPAPTISPGVRRRLTEAAVALAEQVGYTNAGTVEFLVEDTANDLAEGGEEGGVYFLEMNTRLQVEHPVTELVTGLDLVQLQLAVAAGEPLPFTQDQVTVTGHAIEARVYAEDAFAGYLPQAGVAEHVRWTDRARVDEALESGQEVGSSYDPMLGKVIAHGPTREAARRSLVTALDDTAILGLTTNLGFLRGLADSAAFRDCAIDTAFLDSHPDAVAPPDPTTAALLAAWALATRATAEGPGATDPEHPFGTGDGWRLSGPAAAVPVDLVVDGAPVQYRVDPSGMLRTPERSWSVHPIAAPAGVLRLEIDDLVHEGAVRVGRHRVDVACGGTTFGFERPDAFGPGSAAAVSDGTVLAPMPGTVLSVNVAQGDAVAEGTLLGVLEAMKMELALKAPVTGTVAGVDATTGDQVALGARLFVVEAAPDPAPGPAGVPRERSGE